MQRDILTFLMISEMTSGGISVKRALRSDNNSWLMGITEEELLVAVKNIGT